MDKQIIENRDELKKNIDLLVELAYKQGRYDGLNEALTKKPQGLLERNKDKILQAGMEGKEIKLRIDERLFRIIEVAQ
jgi:hypothetical protein